MKDVSNENSNKEETAQGIQTVARPRSSIKEKLKHELESMALAVLYFGVWISALVIFKKLILAQYQIEFNGLSAAFVGTLVLAKVVLVLEHVPLGAWVRAMPAWVEVMMRTVLYAFGLLVVLLLEKAFELRHEYGGFVHSLRLVFYHTEVHHVWVNTICLSGALLGYNMLSVIRRHLGKGGLLRLFLSPLPEELHK
jgi:hypothetical protein